MVDAVFEEYIPTDKWSLTDWYLSKVVFLDRLFNRLVQSQLSGGNDNRTMIAFVSAVRSYLVAARKNFKTHLSDAEFRRLLEILPKSSKQLSYDCCFELMELVSEFHWKSGLTKLSETRAIGSFAKARQSLGLPQEKKEGVDG